MKQTFKKLVAILVIAIMIVGAIPTFAIAEAIEDAVNETKARPNGYIHTGMHGANTVSNAYASGDMETYYRLTGNKRDTLPSSYDSRNYNCVTSVKNQNPYGSCWAHAAMASVESYMIKHGIPVGTGSAATTTLNLSETQHCFFNYTSAYDAEGMLTGDKSNVTASGANNGLDCGGNGEMSAYTLQRWCGAASESVSALSYSNASTVASSGLNSQYAYGSNVTHVQNSVWIPASDIEGVKRAIMEYGAGNISYYAGSSYSTYTNTYQCTIDTSSTSSSSHKFANHAITLVGWDDNISASSFRPNTPSGKGGWLCKNSWGTSVFNSGYMYISYEDTSVLEGYIYFYDAAPVDNYDHNYQYDGSCNVVTFGKGWNSSISTCTGFANNTKVANVFTAKGSEMLQAIAYCNWDEAMTYTVEIYKNPTTGNPSSGTLMSSQTGFLTYSGYYTIPLETPVQLSAGDTFSVVITQNVAAADENGYYVHTPYDSTFNNSSVVSWANWVHTNHGNTSYYKEPNGSWTDCVGNGDFRIKAYTDDYENTYVVTATTNNANYGTVSVTGTTITATPAPGYYVESCTLVSGTATWTINGNTISVAPTSDCTIRVNFAPKPSYTVNYVASGTAQGSVTAYVNDVITLPGSVTVNPDEWTFIGWVTAQLAETDTAPTYYAPGASYTVTGNATFYALYDRLEGGGGEVVYQLTDHLEDGVNYILVAQSAISGTTGKAVGNTTVKNNQYLSPITITVNSDDTVTATSANLPKVLWKAAGNDANGYSFYNENVGKYMCLDSTGYLIPGTTALAWYYTSAQALDNKVDSEGYYYLSYAEASSSWYSSMPERYTTSTSEAVIKLYAETQSGTTYYTTDPVAATPTYYTVTFKDWNGTVLSTQQVEQGQAATAPANPTRVGYTFTGWDVAFDNVQSDLVVTAQYQINTYTVTFKDWDGTVLKTQTVNYGGAATAPANPTREGYTFIGWDVAFNNVTSNLVVTAQYEQNAPSQYLKGDVNCDGIVDSADITLAAAYAMSAGSVSAQGVINGDMNGDGVLTAADLSALYSYIQG